MEKTRQDIENKAKVDKAIIIVSGTKEESVLDHIV